MPADSFSRLRCKFTKIIPKYSKSGVYLSSFIIMCVIGASRCFPCDMHV